MVEDATHPPIPILHQFNSKSNDHLLVCNVQFHLRTEGQQFLYGVKDQFARQSKSSKALTLNELLIFFCVHEIN